MVKKCFLILLMIAIGSTLSSLGAQQAEASTTEIQIYFEGERLTFEDADPVLIQGRTMVPFRKIFETLGYEVKWIGGERQVIGEKEGTLIKLTIDHNVALVNNKEIQLDVAAQLHQSRTFVPLRFVAENSGFHVYFTNMDGVFIVGIGATEESAKPSDVNPPVTVPDPDPGLDPEPGSDPDPVQDPESPEPYVVKGRVVNALGDPLAGVMVYADNTFVYDSWIEGVTDQQGNYELQLPNIAASYRMGAIYETELNGETVPFHFDPEPNSAFGSNEGAVRNFVLDINKGTIQIFEFDYYDDEEAPDVELVDIEFTLHSVGQLVDGSTDRTIITSPSKKSLTVEEIPIGTYELSAVWKPKDYKEVPMLVRVRFTDEYKDKVTISFENTFLDVFVAQIDLTFP